MGIRWYFRLMRTKRTPYLPLRAKSQSGTGSSRESRKRCDRAVLYALPIRIFTCYSALNFRCSYICLKKALQEWPLGHIMYHQTAGWYEWPTGKRSLITLSRICKMERSQAGTCCDLHLHAFQFTILRSAYRSSPLMWDVGYVARSELSFIVHRIIISNKALP